MGGGRGCMLRFSSGLLIRGSCYFTGEISNKGEISQFQGIV